MDIFSTFSASPSRRQLELNDVYDRSDFLQRQPQPVHGNIKAVHKSLTHPLLPLDLPLHFPAVPLQIFLPCCNSTAFSIIVQGQSHYLQRANILRPSSSRSAAASHSRHNNHRNCSWSWPLPFLHSPQVLFLPIPCCRMISPRRLALKSSSMSVNRT